MAFVNETQSVARNVSGLLGPDAIRAALKTIPNTPGAYRMIAANGDVLYVGKAKNLFNRVSSYANAQHGNNRTMRMVAQVAQVEVVEARSEAEALLIEAGLIRRLRPHYNILLKDDKSFPYLLMTDHEFPRITKHRGAQGNNGTYFGPFASAGALNQTLTLLQKVFLLRPCADTIFKNRTRPCLQYQIKRCSAPCVSYIDKEKYAAQVKRATDFLHGRHRELQDMLQAEMASASAAQDYELAAHLRDRIRDLTQVQQEQSIYARGLDDADVIALARNGARSVVQVFFFRENNHLGNQSFHPGHEAGADDAEVMAAFLGQFYQAHTPPKEILVSVLPAEPLLLEEALCLKAGYRITIRQPQRGDKLTLIGNAQSNAQAVLAREEQQRSAVMAYLARLQELFQLRAVPERIEVYDNSHIMGSNALGALVVATPAGFDKRGYRTFNIKDAGTVPGDDYAMMREVFRRRFAKMKKERDAAGWQAPDLILIDGGKGQLSAAAEALKEAGVEGLTLVAIAKGEERNAGREWFFQESREPFQLPLGDPVLHYLQRLRDEAHRFAISRHRRKRSAAMTISALDDIPAVGAARKRALLLHFGSRAKISAASLSELENVSGISKKTAKSIYDFFHA